MNYWKVSMKTLNLRMFVSLALFLVNTNAYAGGLLKEIATTAAEGTAANVKAMTPRGLSRFLQYKRAYNAVEDGYGRTLVHTNYGDRALSLF